MRMEGKKLRKIKLGILTMGILILGVILSLKYGGAVDKTEMEFSDRRETEEAPGARESGTEEPEPELLPFTGSIRVLLKTDGFAGLLHEKATFISENGNDLILTDRDTGETIEEGNRLELTGEDGVLYLNGEPLEGRPRCLRTQAAEAGIRVASLTRNAGHPVYGGALEIWPADEGFYLVNEVPLETYLAYVVPSEMPSGYHMEALKAQAGLRPDLCVSGAFRIRLPGLRGSCGRQCQLPGLRQHGPDRRHRSGGGRNRRADSDLSGQSDYGILFFHILAAQPAIRRSGGTAIRQRHPIWPERPWTQPGKR